MSFLISIYIFFRIADPNQARYIATSDMGIQCFPMKGKLYLISSFDYLLLSCTKKSLYLCWDCTFNRIAILSCHDFGLYSNWVDSGKGSTIANILGVTVYNCILHRYVAVLYLMTPKTGRNSNISKFFI